MIARLAAFEDRGGTVHHIQYGDLMKDPIAEMRSLYRAYDEPLTAEAEAAMQATLAANPKGKHGKHDYRLEDYGLTREGIHDHFRAYTERYGIATKA
jgi:hypothetical protein